ncbi:MAG TPA: DUF2069 domain-containing protein [Vicinamibacterales bacterium]|nr:DUF2069 domain-containing protein [Vicinamibacterales bacterium]
MSMSPARLVATMALLALLLIQPIWHCWLFPPQRLPAAFVTGLAAFPLLAPALGVLLRRPSALFYAALLGLIYFSHGVMEAFANPAVRGIAAAEIAAATLLCLGVGWDGLQRRRAARRG